MSKADIGYLINADLLISGVLMILLAPLWGWLLRFFPPLVTGTVITLIGRCSAPARRSTSDFPLLTLPRCS